MNNLITVAICVYNGADFLPGLLTQLTKQNCTIPYEILIVDNNSTDSTTQVVKQFSDGSKIPVRIVNETTQGIPFARNRAIEESLNNKYMAFIDVDEIPEPTWLFRAVAALTEKNAECVGGRIHIDLPGKKPCWLSDQLLPFLGKVDHGSAGFWVKDRSTPVWSGNVAYNTTLFSDGLRFDTRYNRRGKGVGGGSDGIMFRTLLNAKRRIRYEPEMAILHVIPREKIKRSFFLKLHFLAGKKAGMFEAEDYSRKIFGIPPFLIPKAIRQSFYAIKTAASGKTSSYVREAMNASYTLGMINGYFLRSPEADHHT